MAYNILTLDEHIKLFETQNSFYRKYVYLINQCLQLWMITPTFENGLPINDDDNVDGELFEFAKSKVIFDNSNIANIDYIKSLNTSDFVNVKGQQSRINVIINSRTSGLFEKEVFINEMKLKDIPRFNNFLNLKSDLDLMKVMRGELKTDTFIKMFEARYNSEITFNNNIYKLKLVDWINGKLIYKNSYDTIEI